MVFSEDISSYLLWVRYRISSRPSPAMITNYLIFSVIALAMGAMLPRLTKNQKNTSWIVFILRKPLPLLCFGASVGLLICALIA
jgi:hypothetical protein